MRYNPATDDAKTIEELAFPKVSVPKSKKITEAEKARFDHIRAIMERKYPVKEIVKE